MKERLYISWPSDSLWHVRATAGELIGAVGVTGDTEDRDEELAAYGIRAIGLKTDEDCAELGRRTGIRLTNKWSGIGSAASGLRMS